jgi:cytochrome c5
MRTKRTGHLNRVEVYRRATRWWLSIAVRIIFVGGARLGALFWVAMGALMWGAETKHPLEWDASEKTYEAKPGDEVAEFSFTVRNKSERSVDILELKPSCGCTVAEMPATPWVIDPGSSGSFQAKANFKGRQGRFSKTIHVLSSAGAQVLSVHVNIPDTEESRRARNQMLASADRQAVFRGECASCHVAPTRAKLGGALFATACGICHTPANRASMVPDLAVAREPRDAAYWSKWISEGKERTSMPGFAVEHGGPLSEEQIRSLVEFALKHLPTEPSVAP